MIVVDASAVIELMVRSPAAAAVELRLFGGGDGLHAPHLIDAEATQVMRRYVLAGELPPSDGRQGLALLAALPIRRWGHASLLPRIWALRETVTAYDAAYVALAEALGARLITRDQKLAATPGVRAVIEVV